jgi:large subunit ribosomal protein L4
VELKPMELDVFDIQRNKVGEVSLPDGFFPEDWKPWLVQEVIKELAQGNRAGTRKAKSRGEVSGGGKKPWKQKGTGRARQGSNTSPVWARGGTAHGPKPKEYSAHVSKKKKIAALRQILGYKYREGQLFVLDPPVLPEPKTRLFAKNFASFLSPYRTALFFVDKQEDTFFRVTRNLPWTKTLAIEGLNVYDLAKHDVVVFAKKTFEELLGKHRWTESSTKS